MVINISVQYSGGLLPDIILLTQGYYQWGTRLGFVQYLQPLKCILLLPCVMVYYTVLFLVFFWCPYMAINVNVQYNGGLLPDIILLTRCYLHRGTCLYAMERFCICSLSLIPPKRFDIFFPVTGGCSDGLGAF